jgi:hypothetical protein
LVSLLCLSLLGAATPDVLCLEPGVCTPVVRLDATPDGEVHVRHTLRLPTRVDASGPFAAWMPWPRPPAEVKQRVVRRAAAVWTVGLASTRLRLSLLPGVLTEPSGGTGAGVLAFLASDPLAAGETSDALPEAVGAAETLELLDGAQRAEVKRWRTAHAAWRGRVTSAWTAFAKTPREAPLRAQLLESMTSEPAPPAAEQFLTAAQRTELRRKGHALEGRVVLEDVSADAYRIRVEAVPLGQLVEDWNAGLRALVSRLERVPRPRFHVISGHRHDEVSFSLDVRSDVEETRVSQVSRRLAEIPGLEPDGTQLPPPGL